MLSTFPMTDSDVAAPVVLHATLEPWPAARDARGERMVARCSNIVSGPYAEEGAPTRITTRMIDPQVLEFTVTSTSDVRALMTGLHTVALLGYELMTDSLDARLTWQFSGISLDRPRLALALAEWARGEVPIDALIAFNFSVWSEGRKATGAMSKGLRAIVGQEIACWPTNPDTRRDYVNALVRVAQRIVEYGPVRRPTREHLNGSPVSPLQLEPYGDYDNPSIVELVVV